MSAPTLPSDLLNLRPIGVIRTRMRLKFDTPHQPNNSENEQNCIELYPGNGYELALRDLISFDRIWLLWWFHKNTTWRPLVLPPRGDARRRGVFATRSPHRPNPLGMTSVPLISVSRLKVIVGNTDLLDGTPILDIKPYLSTVDAFSEASLGWLAGVEEAERLPTRYVVAFSALAEEQLKWLKNEWSVDFVDRAVAILSRDPGIHRTRRIRRFKGLCFQLGCGAWRAIFSLCDHTVVIERIQCGYPERLLLDGTNEFVPDRAAQIAFGKRF